MPTPGDPDPPFRPGLTFQLFTGALLIVLALALAFGVAHRSGMPVVMGRYSIEYLALLAALMAAIGAVVWILFWPRPATVRWASNFYLVLSSTIVALASAEIGLRLLNPWGIEFFSTLPYHMQGMVDHPQLGFAHPRSVSYQLGRNRVSLNANGHRDDEMPVRKPAGERRILVLGDSVAFGWGVNDGEDVSARLEAMLRLKNKGVWQVINTGVNGYNSEQEAVFFATEGIAFEPDIVVLIYVANDVDPVFDPKPVTWRRYPAWPSSLPELLDRGRSLSYLYQATKLFQRMHELETARSAPTPPSITRHVRWPESLQALRTIADLSRTRGIQFLLATNSSTDPEFFLALKHAGIDAISLGPAWDAVPPGQRHVSRIDPHPSASVHVEFATRLHEEIQSRGWLDATRAP